MNILRLFTPQKTEKNNETLGVTKIGKDQLDKVIKDAEIQLDGYMTSKRFDRPDVRGFYAFFFGGEVYKWGEWEKD